MTLNYIDNPNIKRHKIKELVQTIIEEGLPNKWVIVDTTDGKTEKEYKNIHNKFHQCKNRYKNMEWAVHNGENNYSIICREKEMP
jgi:SRSO17 transposase